MLYFGSHSTIIVKRRKSQDTSNIRKSYNSVSESPCPPLLAFLLFHGFFLAHFGTPLDISNRPKRSSVPLTLYRALAPLHAPSQITLSYHAANPALCENDKTADLLCLPHSFPARFHLDSTCLAAHLSLILGTPTRKSGISLIATTKHNSSPCLNAAKHAHTH